MYAYTDVNMLLWTCSYVCMYLFHVCT